MFSSLNALKNNIQTKIEEKKAQYEEKKQSKWLSEVTTQPTAPFYAYEQWKQIYEPVKIKEKSTHSDALNKVRDDVAKKAENAITKQMTGKIMKGLADVMAQVVNIAEQHAKTKDEQLSHVLNSIQAIFLTYRFSYKDVKKFTWLRSVAIDRLAFALIGLVDSEAKRLNMNPESLSPEMIEQIVNTIGQRVYGEVDARKVEAIAALKSSPLFGVTTNVAASHGVTVDVDQLAELLLGFIRSYVEGKLGLVMDMIKISISSLTKITIKHRTALLQHMAAKHEDPDNAPDSYKNGVKAELTREIEGRYNELEGKLSALIGKIFARLHDEEGEE